MGTRHNVPAGNQGASGKQRLGGPTYPASLRRNQFCESDFARASLVLGNLIRFCPHHLYASDFLSVAEMYFVTQAAGWLSRGFIFGGGLGVDEGAEFGDLGPDDGAQHHDDQCADAAGDYGDDGAEEAGSDAAFEAA